MSDQLDLGPCCACHTTGSSVRNIVMLSVRASVPGTGWGCFVCGLRPDGAITVLCDDCLEQGREAQEICRGYPVEHGRAESSSATDPYEHDETRHAAVAGSHQSYVQFELDLEHDSTSTSEPR